MTESCSLIPDSASYCVPYCPELSYLCQLVHLIVDLQKVVENQQNGKKPEDLNNPPIHKFSKTDLRRLKKKKKRKHTT